MSLADSLLVDELVEPNPVPPRKRTATKSSRKAYLHTKLQHPRGWFNWVAAWGVLLRNRRNRSISGYAKERVVLEFLIQVPFPPNRVDGGIEQQLKNEGSADPTHHRSKSKSLRIFVT